MAEVASGQAEASAEELRTARQQADGPRTAAAVARNGRTGRRTGSNGLLVNVNSGIFGGQGREGENGLT